MAGFHWFVILLTLISVSQQESDDADGTHVLVLGGQGLAGSATLSSLLSNNYKVSALNNGKDYYDYTELFEHRVEGVGCVRSAGLQGCFELQQFLKQNTKISAVVDFTSSTNDLMSEAVQILSPLSPDVYIFISAAAVYDVAIDSEQPLKEENGVRPEDEAQRALHSENNKFGDNMLDAEDVLVKSGLPYVILRCADLVGPRDTTYRWWQYQIWGEHFKIINQGFPISEKLQSIPFSLTYGDDVAQSVLKVLEKRIVNEVYNIALEKSFSLTHILLELCSYLETMEDCFADYSANDDSYNLYPSNHQGLVSIEKAISDLGFEPTPWDTVLKDTVEWYKEGLGRFEKERDIVLNRLNKNAVPYLRIEPLSGAIKDAIAKLNVGNTSESNDEVVVDTSESNDEVVVDTSESNDEVVVDTSESNDEVVVDTSESNDEVVVDTSGSNDEVVGEHEHVNDEL